MPRVVVAVLGGLIAAGLLYAVLLDAALRSGLPLSWADGLGIVGPLLVGGVVGVLAWPVLSGADRSDRAATSTCEACGSPIMKDWRLCPHCGRFASEDIARSCQTPHH